MSNELVPITKPGNAKNLGQIFHFGMKGELLAARKAICIKLAENRERMQRASFDVCLAFQVRLVGFRAIFEPSAQFHEYAPTTLRDRLKVQTRRASFLVGTFFSFRHMVCKRELGTFGTVILPAHLMMLVIIPWLVLVVLAMLVMDMLRIQFSPLQCGLCWG